MRSTKFRFTDLPAEIRNRIYQIRAKEDVIVVSIVSTLKPYTLSDHSLHLVSKLVHKEFSGVLKDFAVLDAIIIVGEVTDFNFATLITFLNRIKDGQLVDFAEDRGGRRKLFVDFSITNEFCKNPDTEEISAWFRFAARKVRKGDVFDVTYFVDKVESKSLTREALDSIAAGFGQSGPWEGMQGAFRRWYDEQGDDDDDESMLLDNVTPASQKEAKSEDRERAAAERDIVWLKLSIEA